MGHGGYKIVFSQKYWSFSASENVLWNVSLWTGRFYSKEVLEKVTQIPTNISSFVRGNITKNLLGKREAEFLGEEVSSLLKKGVIVKSYHEAWETISPIFLWQKSDGIYRFILNLKTWMKMWNTENSKSTLCHQYFA